METVEDEDGDVGCDDDDELPRYSGVFCYFGLKQFNFCKLEKDGLVLIIILCHATCIGGLWFCL